MIVKTGLEVLRDDGFKPLPGLRVGLLTNPSAVNRKLESTYSILLTEPSVNVVALFGPEHGFMGSAPAGEQVASGFDPRSGLPVHSLYGDMLRPTEEMLREIDVIVCDVQDIGARYYTYVWTISHVLEAAGTAGVSVVILDRPNPLGGLVVDGPLVESHLSSLVGRFPVPVCHGMTLGELAWMINETWNPSLARLSIVPCHGLERTMTWKTTGLHWVPPSPNIPCLGAVRQYPGACLIEGTNLSEGRGTVLPFEIVGAPWVDGVTLALVLNAQDWAEDFGVRFRPHTFLPTASKYAGQQCEGVQVHIVHTTRWRALPVWLGTISVMATMYPENFAWLAPQNNNGVFHFDRLIGSETYRQAIEAGSPLDDLVEGWVELRLAFRQQRRPFLLYE